MSHIPEYLQLLEDIKQLKLKLNDSQKTQNMYQQTQPNDMREKNIVQCRERLQEIL